MNINFLDRVECIPFNIESTWLYLQSNISLLHVGMKQVLREIIQVHPSLEWWCSLEAWVATARNHKSIVVMLTLVVVAEQSISKIQNVTHFHF